MNRWTYTGREALGDSEGLYYYRWRVMDPNTGRFTSEDPLGFVDGPNRYVYCAASPVNLVDPYGESFQVIAAFIAAGGAVLAASYTGMKVLCSGIYLIDQTNKRRCEMTNDEYEEEKSIARDFCKRLGWYKSANPYNPNL